MSLNLSSNFLQFKIEMAKDSKHKVYEFDEFRLDRTNLMLYRAGEEISLPPKVIETLVVLVENQGEIISKNELMDRVWADSIVEESNLSQSLYRLRKTLGERANGEPYIETLRRRGYRFNGEVRLLETAPIKNGDAPQAEKNSAASRRVVQRNGNVVTLADWREAEAPIESSDMLYLTGRNKVACLIGFGGRIGFGGSLAYMPLAMKLKFSISSISIKTCGAN